MTIFQTRIQLRHAVLSREGTNQTAVVLCVALRPRGNRTRKWLCGGRERERERERERGRESVCTLRDTFMAQSTVYSNIVTPSCKGMRCTARTKSIQHPITRILRSKDRFLIYDSNDSLLILTLTSYLNSNGNYLYIVLNKEKENWD